MAKKKVCKRCKVFVDGSECPLCKMSSFSVNWNGRIAFIDKDSSHIAEKMNVSENGEYAIKVK